MRVAYNLIDERWIPVRRKSGKVERIAPWQIAEQQDPAVRIESTRPDFDAALLEMLIGLVQTVMTPKDEVEWADTYESGIAPEKLKKRMASVRDAFFLDGDGPRFFQDLTVDKDPKVDEKPIVGLLIDQGEEDLGKLFAKEGRYPELSLPAAAAAILALQSFAPEGGRGQFTSMRGGGPLSVAVQDSCLWSTVWCNILNEEDLREVPGNRRKTAWADQFPWLRATKAQGEGGSKTFPEDVHPFQHYWGLPRRFRLVVEDGAHGRCAIYGDVDVPVIRFFSSRPGGTAYDGPFLHPLTAYTEGKDGERPNSKKAGRAGLPYRDWQLLSVGGPKLIPPKVVEVFYRHERWRIAPNVCLSARGYSMKSMKPLRFIEASAPVVRVVPTLRKELQAEVAGLIEASESVRLTLFQQVKSAWSERPGDQPGEVEARTDAAFWSATEGDFYRALPVIASSLGGEDGEKNARDAAKTEFLGRLLGAALRIFDELCPAHADVGADDLARVVRARKALAWFARAEALLPKVGLAKEETKTDKPARKSRRKEGKSP